MAVLGPYWQQHINFILLLTRYYFVVKRDSDRLVHVSSQNWDQDTSGTYLLLKSLFYSFL